MAIQPPPGKWDDAILSLTSVGRGELTGYRNESKNGWGRLVTTELGYGLLAFAAVVETVFRAVIVLVAATFFVVTVPIAGLWLDNWKEDVLDMEKNLPLGIAAFGAVTILVSGNEALANVVALIQNPLKGEGKLKAEHCTFAALCCSSAPAKKQANRAEAKTELPAPQAAAVGSATASV